METGRKEFVKTVCNIYMILLVAVLPLYTRGSYYQLGDNKYLLFRNVSLLCLGIWLLFAVIDGLGMLLAKMRLRFTCRVAVCGEHMNSVKMWNSVDIFMILYGVCAFISALASPYGVTPWLGYRDWYMGAISQILFVGIYFCVSREYIGSACPIYLGEAALLLVGLTAFLQRCGIDPLRLQQSFQTTDWEYSHMLSTVGNINWLCGYLSVLLPWPVVGFLYSQKIGKQIVCYIISVLALWLMLTQGSDVGIILTVACLGLGFFYGIRRRDFFRKSTLLALGVCVLCPISGYLMNLLKTREMLAADGFISGLLTEPFWWVLVGILVIMYLLQGNLPGKITRRLNQFMLIGGIVIAVCLAGIYLCGLPEGSAWGSGRGGLWQAAWKGFCRMDWRQKLWGVGPDCFAEYIYDIPSIAGLIQPEGHWEKSIFANAHNEWLNLLVNEGVFGVAAYLGVFLCGLRRYRGMLLGVMVLLLYGINSLFSFQQVVSTPLLFLVLGICESRLCKGKDLGNDFMKEKEEC